tara:strand:+ start:110 stop:709 length:600 start_codon:yes stop_codon:yes gene_type:complete
MKIAITGSSGLAKTIKDTLEATPFKGKMIKVDTPRIEDILMNDVNWYGFDNINPNHVDVLINFAHNDFDQTKILAIAHEAWRYDKTKQIINFSSRASQPNISKGYLYAAQKSSLNHLSNNLTYNSEKRYKLTTINLGLLNHEEIPSLTSQDVANVCYYLITAHPGIEIPEITIQAHANYQEVQSLKEMIKKYGMIIPNY